MFIVRYATESRVVDLRVTAEQSINTFNKINKLFGEADLLFVDNGVEYCLL